ncbi:hypothetical protein TTHERM_00393120 (macronuclear) [Tetrahymena thermophila SB210]|uniref:Uncharacterized protein n=1 Tax=Tetrahymena thermophila (strain SB210) TaxID=312017 RepID=Q233D7_TETTS|nr:hypothetical protein TTHERM_00393120 [Tetrahymena thermophila SB210]EAR91643.2 hypothetical protein TTHERM_00393120 [Tetrahymena thermophila SB210]|eukprot:XP_001011888.2 hypothetical protein TTHERM_00393120 [Tetrahymena thermophila SB210]
MENQLHQVFLSKKQVRSQNDITQETCGLFPKNVLLSEIEQSKFNNSEFYDKYELYQNFDNNQENIEIINDQQRVCQIIINLLENSLDYLNKVNLISKYVKLLIKIVKGKDENSNLIEFKVINNAELNYSKQEIFLVKESLKVEREIKNNYFMWNSQSCLQPTQMGLKLNQKILEKTSPQNFMNIACDDDKIGFSFYIFQNCNILQQDYKQDFQNKLFDEIRCQSQIQNENSQFKIDNSSTKIEEVQKQINQQNIGKDTLKISKNIYTEKEKIQKKKLTFSNEELIYNQPKEIDETFEKNESVIDQFDERVNIKDFQVKGFNSKNAESLNKQQKKNSQQFHS